MIQASAQNAAGVIWRGDSVIDGVPETLDLLRSLVSVAILCMHQATPYISKMVQGKKLVFVTNNSTKSRAGYLSKFHKLGLNVTAVRAELSASQTAWENPHKLHALSLRLCLVTSACMSLNVSLSYMM